MRGEGGNVHRLLRVGLVEELQVLARAPVKLARINNLQRVTFYGCLPRRGFFLASNSSLAFDNASWSNRFRGLHVRRWKLRAPPPEKLRPQLHTNVCASGNGSIKKQQAEPERRCSCVGPWPEIWSSEVGEATP
jgi:hypothetical protein